MEFGNKLIDHPCVRFVIHYVQKQSKALTKDIIGAYKLFFDHREELAEGDVDRLARVEVMCKYMEPEIEDIVAMLLFHDYLLHKVTMRAFLQTFSEKRYERYYSQMIEACKNAPKNDELSVEDRISFYIMMRVCDKMYARLTRRLNKRSVSVGVISKAYDIAKRAYYFTVRKTGEPCLAPPLSVADILTDIGVESEVIAAALLHNVVEGNECTLDEISKVCGERTVRYVEAVTSLQREYRDAHKSAEHDLGKPLLDRRSFDRLVRSVAASKEMHGALYVVAADRIHDLRTIESMPSIGTHENDGRGIDYLPLFRVFRLNYFVLQIEDLMWRAENIDCYTRTEEKYAEMIAENGEFIEEFKMLLRSNFENNELNARVQASGSAGYDVEVGEKHFLPHEVLGHIQKAVGSCDDPVRYIEKNHIPLCDIEIIADPRDKCASRDTFLSGFVKMFEEKIALTGRAIIDFYEDAEKGVIILVEDRYRNVFRCCISMRDDYTTQRIGTGTSFSVEDCEVDEAGEPRMISVRLRNGKSISLPKGSTVIDVAFAIHDEIGFTARSATVNGVKATVYSTLSDGDKVIIEADTFRKNGETKQFIRHVRIGWLNYVRTKKAKKKIIEFLTALYEGDDPRSETEAPDPLVDRVSNAILLELRRSQNAGARDE